MRVYSIYTIFLYILTTCQCVREYEQEGKKEMLNEQTNEGTNEWVCVRV